jgi:hypothetical protein
MEGKFLARVKFLAIETAISKKKISDQNSIKEKRANFALLSPYFLEGK